MVMVNRFARHYLPNKSKKSKVKRARGAKKANLERKIQNRSMVDNMSGQSRLPFQTAPRLQSQVQEEHRTSKIMLKIWKIKTNNPTIGEAGKLKMPHGNRSRNPSDRTRHKNKPHMPNSEKPPIKNMASLEAHMT